MSELYYESSIAHHGIKGQRWGFRRFQNSDGSLTSAGRKRQQKQMQRIVKKERAQQHKLAVENLRVQEQLKTAQAKAKLEDSKRALSDARSGKVSSSTKSNPSRPSASDMSYEELRDVVNRLNLEARYKELTKVQVKESPIKKVLIDASTEVLKDVTKKTLNAGVNALLDPLLESSKNGKKDKKKDKDKGDSK